MVDIFLNIHATKSITTVARTKLTAIVIPVRHPDEVPVIPHHEKTVTKIITLLNGGIRYPDF